MKGKKLSKALAFLLAVVMVFTTLPMFAFAEDEPYVVSYGSPAILMNEGTWVDLSDIYVEMDAAGTTVSGADITWAAEKQDGMSFNAAEKTVNAKAAGRYKLTATANGVTKNVWVLAKTAEETDFYLVNIPSLNSNTYNPEDWKAFGTKTSNAAPDLTAFTTSSTYIKTPGSTAGACIVYNDDIFEDFADYTVIGEMATNAAKSANVTNVGGGLIARAHLDTDGAKYASGIVAYYRQSQQMGILKPTATTSYTGCGTSVTPGTDEYYPWAGQSDFHTLTAVYSGTSMKFYFGEKEVFDSEKVTNYPCGDQTQPGYPGLIAYGCNGFFKSFAVKLNTNELAPTFEKIITTYTVANESPAIPMNEMTTVKLEDIDFEIGGERVNGADVELKLDAQTSNVIVSGGVITAYAKGIYPATVKYGDNEATVYIVVKAETDTEWVLYEQTFGDYSAATTENPVPIPDGWVSQAYASESHLDASIRYTYVEFENVRPYATSNNTFTAPGVVPIGKYRDLPGGVSMYGAPAYFTLNDSVVKNFADYTITSNMVIYSNSYYCAYTTSPVGAGLFGRAQVNATGKMDVENTDFSAIVVDPASRTKDGVAYGLNVAHLKMISKPNNSDVRAKKTATFFKEDDANIRWSYLNGKQNKEVSLTLKYDGTTATLSSSADTEARTFTVSDIADNNGAVGVAVQQFDDSGPTTAVNVKTFKVALNNAPADCPTYSDIQLYSVDDNTPVVPMTAHSSTALANIMVNFGGNAVVANAAEWVSKSNQLKFENGNAIVYGAGTYTATATYNGEVKTIYFVAKNADDEHYVVYGADFDREVGNDWTLYNGSFAVLDKTDVYNDTSNYEMFNGFKIAQNNYLMLDNEIIRNLRDYTMSVEFGYSGTMSDNSWGCLYLLGRADVTVPTADFNTAMVGFMPRLSSTPIRLFYRNDKYNTNCKDTAEQDYIYTVGDLVEATVKLNDKQVIATIDGVEIYDTLKDSAYTATMRDRLPVTGGNVGLKASYNYAIKRYEIRLNAETVEGAPACAPLNNVLTNNTLYMTEGTRLAMSDVKLVFGNETVAGDKAKWSYVRNDVTEVSDFFKTVCAFTEGSENITATYNGQTINITIVVETVKTANTYPVLTSMVETDGNGTAVIKPVADDNYAYQIAITPNAGYVVDTDKSYVYSYKTTIKMLGRTADSTGNTLVADFDALDDIVVNLTFKADKAADVTMIGSTIRYANEETGVTNGIRFGMRSYNVKNARIDTIIVDGVEYNVVGVGMVMLPKPLLEGELTVNTKNARYKEFTSVVDSTANYADFAMVLTNLPEEYLTLDIASRGFIKYEISEGNYGYYYADELQSSFEKIEKRIESAELKFDFYYSDFDKGYITMVYDDYRGDLGTVFNIFQEYNIPLVAAIPPETVTSDSKAALLHNIQNAGGEIIGHHFTVLTSAMTSEQKFDKLKTTYDVLTSYGLNVNGYILAGGTNQGDIDRKEIETMLRKIGFSYSDLYGISPNYYHPRSSMATSNDSTIKKNITTAGNSKTWLSFYAHDLNTERTADELRELIEYIQADPNVEIVTYKYIYQNFGNFRNPVNWNNGVTA